MIKLTVLYFCQFQGLLLICKKKKKSYPPQKRSFQIRWWILLLVLMCWFECCSFKLTNNAFLQLTKQEAPHYITQHVIKFEKVTILLLFVELLEQTTVKIIKGPQCKLQNLFSEHHSIQGMLSALLTLWLPRSDC